VAVLLWMPLAFDASIDADAAAVRSRQHMLMPMKLLQIPLQFLLQMCS